MNIAWLWHYTNSNNPEALRIKNEKNAFAMYARWRALVRWTSQLNTFFYLYFQKRAARRKLMSLPDYLLSDIGMYRSGNEIKVEMIRPADSKKSAVLTSNNNKNSECVVLSAGPATKNQPAHVSVDSACRAA